MKHGHNVSHIHYVDGTSWTNAVMRKLICAHIKSPSELKSYIVHETLNPHLENSGDSELHPTTQKGFLALIDGNQDFW